MTALSLLDRTTARQHLDRVWMAELTKSQWKIVCHVFDRTIAWGRAECAISVPEFAGGSGSYTRGTGLGQSTIYRLLGELVKLGVLTKTERPGRKTIYGLNLKWGTEPSSGEPPVTPESEEPAQMPLPPSKRQHAQASPVAMPSRKAKTGGPTPPRMRGVEGGTPPNLRGAIEGKEDFLQKGKTYRTASDIQEDHSPGSLDKVLEVARKTADQREAKRREREARRLTVGHLTTRFDDAMREHAPDAVRLAWPAKTRGQMKLAIKQDTFAKIDHAAFLTHVVKHWTLIGKTAMHWMDGYPPEPSAQFMASRLTYFVQAYLDRETHLADLNALGIDGLRAKYRRGGMDREAADQAARQQVASQGGVSREEAEALREQLARSEEARRKQERLFKDKLKADARMKAADDDVTRGDLMRRFDQRGGE